VEKELTDSTGYLVADAYRCDQEKTELEPTPLPSATVASEPNAVEAPQRFLALIGLGYPVSAFSGEFAGLINDYRGASDASVIPLSYDIGFYLRKRDRPSFFGLTLSGFVDGIKISSRNPAYLDAGLIAVSFSWLSFHAKERALGFFHRFDLGLGMLDIDTEAQGSTESNTYAFKTGASGLAAFGYSVRLFAHLSATIDLRVSGGFAGSTWLGYTGLNLSCVIY
jgi:hypothetical protein